jgi:hypothetical protein
MPLNTYFGVLRREVGDQLVVDRQVGRQHEEVVDAVRQMQVGDEGAHQARLAHAGGQREAQRRELALEVLQRGELRLQRGEDGGNITSWSWPSISGAASSACFSLASDSACGGRSDKRPVMWF